MARPGARETPPRQKCAFPGPHGVSGRVAGVRRNAGSRHFCRHKAPVGQSCCLAQQRGAGAVERHSEGVRDRPRPFRHLCRCLTDVHTFLSLAGHRGGRGNGGKPRDLPRLRVRRGVASGLLRSLPDGRRRRGLLHGRKRHDECCGHKLDADLDRAGAADDAGAGVLLRRPGPIEKRPQHDDDELHLARIRRRGCGRWSGTRSRSRPATTGSATCRAWS